MKIILIVFLLATVGCTTGHFNPETNEFYFHSTKEFNHFEIIFEDGDKRLTIKAEQVRAFKGQQAVLNSLDGTLEKFTSPF